MTSVTGVAAPQASAPPMDEILKSGVIVTGGSSGLGRETALLLAEGGRPVAVWGTDEKKSEEVARQCRNMGVNALGLGFDLGDRKAVQKGILASREAIGRIGGLACSAGRTRIGPVGNIDFSEWEVTLRTNLTGTAYVMDAALPVLREIGRGTSIVVVASTEALRGSSILAAYTASKHAVLGLVRSASLTLAPEGIRVNAVCAGAMDTPMMAASAAVAGQAVMRQMISAIPLGYIAHPREVAHVINFLLSPNASYVTGVGLPADGGMLA